MSETLLVFPEHREFLDDAVARIAALRRASPEKKVVVEVKTLDEALALLPAAPDVFQCEKMTPEGIGAVVAALAAAGSPALVAAAGGVNLQNAAAYAAAGAHILVDVGALLGEAGGREGGHRAALMSAPAAASRRARCWRPARAPARGGAGIGLHLAAAPGDWRADRIAGAVVPAALVKVAVAGGRACPAGLLPLSLRRPPHAPPGAAGVDPHAPRCHDGLAVRGQMVCSKCPITTIDLNDVFRPFRTDGLNHALETRWEPRLQVGGVGPVDE